VVVISAIPFYKLKDNLEPCNALKNLIKKVPPKAVSVLAKGKKSLKTKSGFVQFTLNQYNCSVSSKKLDYWYALQYLLVDE